MDEPRKNVNKEEIFLRTRVEEMKNTLEGIDNRLEDAEEQTSNLKGRVMKSTQAEQQKLKRIFKNEDRLRELLDTIKQANIQRGVGWGGDRKNYLKK